MPEVESYISARTMRGTIMMLAIPLLAVGGIIAITASPWIGMPIATASGVCAWTAATRDPYVPRGQWWGQWWPAALGWTLAWSLIFALAILAFYVVQVIVAVMVACMLVSAWFFIKRF